MSDEKKPSTKNPSNTLQMPVRLVTTVDMARTLRELKKLDDWLHQAELRTPGQPVKPPKTSASLEEIASLNKVSLLEATHREQLINVLSALNDHAPRIHMAFATEPSPKFLEELIVWLRANISPIILVEVGLQPNLAAGCTVRTRNRLFDMSLRNRFVDSRPKLVESIKAIESKQPTTPENAVVSSTTPTPATTPPQPAPPQPTQAQPTQTGVTS